MAAAPSFDRLLRARGDLQVSLARRVVAEGVPWAKWRKELNAAIVGAPADAERAVHALEQAAEAQHADGALPLIRLARGTLLQRCGASTEASRLLLRAAPGLEAQGHRTQAAQSLVLAVDALAHAGDIDAALKCARRARASLRGPQARYLRAVLRGNRANALRLAGRLEEAIREYEGAAKALERLDASHDAATAWLNAGVALTYAGLVDLAKRRLTRARDQYLAAGYGDAALHADYNLAFLAVRAGDVGSGIRGLESISAQAGTRGLERLRASCLMDLGDALRRVGDFETAARQAQAASDAFDAMGAPAEAAEALWLSAAALGSNDPKAARTPLSKARRRADRAGRADVALRIDALRFTLSLRHNQAVDGRRLAGLERRAEGMGQYEVAWQLHLLRVERALGRGQRTQARRLLDSLPSKARRSPGIDIGAKVLEARLDIEDGDRGRGIRALRTLTSRLDRLRGDLPGAWLQTTFLLDRLDPYLLLVDALLDRDRAHDRRHAEELLDGLALKRFLAARPPVNVRGKVQRWRRRLEVLYDRLSDGGSTTRGLNPAQRTALMDEVRALERRVAQAWREQERGSATASARDARQGSVAFPPTPTMHCWVRDGAVRALLRRGNTVTNYGTLASIEDLRKRTFELQFHAHRVRATGSRGASRSLHRALEAVSALLLGPLALDVALQPTLQLVVDARMPDVPWEVLPFHGRPLAAHVALSRVPAARVPAATETHARGTRVFVSGERHLPAVAREARHVAAKGHVLRRGQATRQAAAEALGSCAVVHFAMHGVAAPLAPALGGVRLDDGWFTAADMPPRVAARLVSLAACQTGALPSPQAQAWGALPSALLRAGVRWVLWTAGDVDDETTADLMSAFHPIHDFNRVPDAMGRALEHVATQQGTVARLLPFRLSGGHA